MDRLNQVPTITPLSTDEAELARLEIELTLAQERLAARRQELADIDLRPALLVEVEASVQRFDAMEREYEARLAHIDDTARLDLERVLVESRSPARTHELTSATAEEAADHV